jgi:ribosomal protein L16/L10AE
MGKGKGKLECWYSHVRSGVSLCEFKNLRPGRSLYFSRQLAHKLGISIKLIFQINSWISLPVSLSQVVKMKVHW